MDTNARVAGRRKGIKERAAKQLCMDNISTGLNQSNDSSILDSSESLSTSLLLLSSFRIFTEPFFSLTSIFFPPYTTAIASLFIRVSNFRFFTMFTHLCIFIPSSLFSLFK